MSSDPIPSRRGTGGSPFLTTAAAARLAGLTSSMLGRRLGNGDLAEIADRGATTIAVLERTMLDARNACTPCVTQDVLPAREVP